jgi:uncharacterized protein YfdQ (DUF2303 family)
VFISLSLGKASETTVTKVKGMKGTKRFRLLNRLSRKVLSHVRRGNRKALEAFIEDYAPSTESSEPRSDDNLESEMASQPKNKTTLTVQFSQRDELETEKDTIAIEKQLKEEKPKKIESNLEPPEPASKPKDPEL